MMQVGKIEYAPDYGRPRLNWDSVARRYVEHDTTAQETFGQLVEPSNDNARPVATATRRGLPNRNIDVMSESLAEIGELPGFIYLGSPYSKYRLGHDTAAYDVSYAAALLMRRGLRIYAPITHGHFISKHAELPQTWEFWKAQCQPMIDAASSLIVLQMHGWEESVGLIYEIAEFECAGKPIVYVDPRELVARSQNMGVAA